jgi:NitT/TauT family transport system substrate-binding protein
MFLVSKEKIDKFEWSMLNGKKIMGQRPGSTPQLSFEYVLKAKGVDAATIKSVITNIGPAARDGAWTGSGFDFGIFFEPSLTKLEKAGQFHVIGSMAKEVGRVDFTSFFAKKSWLAKNGEIAQKWTNAIAKAQAFMRTASGREIGEAITPFFPGISIDEHVEVIDRFRTAGGPIWSDTPEVDKGGIEKLQDMMVIGGVLPADKKIPYDKIVTTDYAKEAQKKLAAR